MYMGLIRPLRFCPSCTAAPCYSGSEAACRVGCALSATQPFAVYTYYTDSSSINSQRYYLIGLIGDSHARGRHGLPSVGEGGRGMGP